MPWAKIPPEKLTHLSLFGYDLIKDEGDFAWYHGPRGRQRIEKATPKVWFEDIGEAHQAGAIAILTPQDD